jgi:dihydroorotate dehydrogenase
MGCGGILSVEDAKRKLEAGADLIQLISGMIFNGPHLVEQINHAITGIPKCLTQQI